MTRTRSPRRLSGALFAVQMAIIIAVVVIVAVVGVVRSVAANQEATEQRIYGQALTLSHLPSVIDAMQGPNAHAEIQPIVDAAMSSSDFRYITVVGMDNIRVAHVDPSEVGEPVSSDHSAIRRGETFAGVEEGTQGITYRVKVPIRTGSGEVVGTLSVGELVSEIRDDALMQVVPLAAVSLLAIVAGAVLAWFVSKWLRRKLYGVEPDQLAQLLQAHRAVMESTEEGVIATDADGRVQLVNREAARMLGVTSEGTLEGAGLDALPEELAQLLEAEHPPEDLQLVHLPSGSVYVHAAATWADGRAIGRMLAMRDRSQLDDAIARLERQREQAQLLRIEAHEFENRMHVLSGLLELGEYEQARAYLEEQPNELDPNAASELDLTALEPPLLAALVSAHAAAASREHVTLELDDASHVPADVTVTTDDLLVVANLLTNAVEATGFGGTVRLTLLAEPGTGLLEIVVEDDGPGFAASPEVLTTGGITTKLDEPERHGIGLFSVQEVVRERGGELRFGASELGGAQVEADLPPASPDTASGEGAPQ